MNFFRKGLKSLEGVDPQIKLVSENQHIDYQFVGLDDGEDGEGESMNSYGNNNDDGESSFDYRQNKLGFDNDCTSRISMEVLCLLLTLVWPKLCLIPSLTLCIE